jgi:pyrroline-5-carboxylate reductase
MARPDDARSAVVLRLGVPRQGEEPRLTEQGPQARDFSLRRDVTKLAIVGGGRMGSALLRGIVASGWASPAELLVVEISEAQRERLARGHPGLAVADSFPSGACDDVVLAVKPQDAEEVCRSLSVRRLLSVAAGITTQELESWLGDGAVVVRAMPNLPALVSHCAAGMARGSRASDEDLAWASQVLGSVGKAVEVPETLMDAVTGLSGSGPAYFFLVVESLIEAGVAVGLDRDTSAKLVRQTFAGAARLLEETGEAAEDLRIAVTSPGGTTAAGIAVLEARKVRDAFVEAVMAATERSRELGSPGHRSDRTHR